MPSSSKQKATIPMQRRTKIIATLGPATDDPAVLDAMFAAGLDAVRVNLSHGSHAEHERRIAQLREHSSRCGRSVALLMDLQGPKIRIGRFLNGAIELAEGEKIQYVYVNRMP